MRLTFDANGHVLSAGETGEIEINPVPGDFLQTFALGKYRVTESGGQFQLEAVPGWQPPPELEPEQATASPEPGISLWELENWVDALAGETRARFISTVPGQEATYLKKADEAARYTEGDDPAGYPYITAEAAATGQTPAAVAALIAAKAAQWTTINAQIEAIRIAAKAGGAALTPPERLARWTLAQGQFQAIAGLAG